MISDALHELQLVSQRVSKSAEMFVCAVLLAPPPQQAGSSTTTLLWLLLALPRYIIPDSKAVVGFQYYHLRRGKDLFSAISSRECAMIWGAPIAATRCRVVITTVISYSPQRFLPGARDAVLNIIFDFIHTVYLFAFTFTFQF